jgi:6-pyruvoyl-tetrahydropterin synthase
MTDFNKKNLFKIPGNYFQELEHSLIENAKAIKVEKSLSTPKNYFNTLEKEILKKIYPEKKPLFNVRRITISFTSIAASFLILFILNPFEATKTMTEDQAFNNYLESYYLEDLDSYEMLSMIEDSEIEKIVNTSIKP